MKALVCEDSMEGIFSGIYHAWAGGYNRHDLKLTVGEVLEYELFCDYIMVKPDAAASEKVARTLCRLFGKTCFEILCYCLKSYDSEKASAIYHTVLYGIENKCGSNLLDNKQNPYIRTTYKLYRNVYNESHHYYGFVRFRELEGDILYCDIEPKNDVLDILAQHFTDRLPGENWLIYDVGRKYGAVHADSKPWYLVRNFYLEEDAVPCHYSQDEQQYQRLWKRFFDTIAIQERENKKLQRTNMPLRFRKHMI